MRLPLRVIPSFRGISSGKCADESCDRPPVKRGLIFTCRPEYYPGQEWSVTDVLFCEEHLPDEQSEEVAA